MIAFGDFQTPLPLAAEVCALVERTGWRPATIVEPTCGTGSFLAAARSRFPAATHILGLDINPEHVARARGVLPECGGGMHAEVVVGDFFRTDWHALLAPLPRPWLVLGNPPWVTNAALGVLGADNLPVKATFPGLSGLEARTGKSNFDISEWVVVRLLEALQGNEAVLAMLVKTSVARKTLARAWRDGLAVRRAALYRLDARRWFGAAVDACLLTVATGGGRSARDCTLHAALEPSSVESVFGWRDGALVADVTAHARVRELAGAERTVWRSGVKHDCARVMELHRAGDRWRNGLGETVCLEPDRLHPLAKCSDLDRGRPPSRWVVVTQRRTGEDTAKLEHEAPQTWAYLLRNAARLDGRASTVYRGRPRFAMFGVGPYAFQPWKVAVSGLHKRLRFRVVGPVDGQAVLLDDTGYLLACRGRAEAERTARLLTSELAQDFFRAHVFWDAKRPITGELLGRLDLGALARALGAGGPCLSAQRRGRASPR
ncbi:MAG: SAM-dependent DNA methyltransferase [Planctomycetes bacterium]|nr:SAM-dependent DNA methyltransferase [Planctomycetota bacterium]